jgi:23S rRNA (cytidine1920-2'-O)/16S rRNA (cytidine1409-2'-O)-methyltransferase
VTKAKSRLDVALVERGLVETRAKAQALIMARRIAVNGRAADKAGTAVAGDDALEVISLEHPWVGRGGMKLAAALEQFQISVSGLVCCDIGASTGGFTDVLLHHGAKRVYAIDVGHGQLDVRLCNDPRVINREKVNARFLTAADFPETIEFVSTDVSFISLTMILPPIAAILGAGGSCVALIKPQFEVGPAELRKGIVRDDDVRAEAVDRVLQSARQVGFDVDQSMESPVRGAEGNIEYLAHLKLPAPR